jgi:hypothetical protein
MLHLYTLSLSYIAAVPRYRKCIEATPLGGFAYLL